MTDTRGRTKCRYCGESYSELTHLIGCSRAPWVRQPGWQIAAPTSSRWIQLRLWLSNKLRRR